MTVSFEQYRERKQQSLERLDNISHSDLSRFSSLEAEEGFIYTFMHSPLDIFEALTKIDGLEYFYHTAPRICYEALRLALDELEDYNEKEGVYEINPISLKGYIELLGKLGSGQGQVSFEYLMRLWGSEDYNPGNLKKYIKQLSNWAARRELFTATTKTCQELANPASKVEDITAHSAEAVYHCELLADLEGKRSDFKPFYTDILEIDNLDFEAMARKRAERPLPVTGVKSLDGDLDRGIFPFFDIGYDDLITVMGATGGGKSSFIHQIVLESAKRGLAIFFANTENNPFAIKLRNICYFTGIDFSRVKLYFSGFASMLSPDEVAHITAVDAALRGLPSEYRGRPITPMQIDFYDASAKTADQLVSEALKRHNLAKRSDKYGRKGYGLFVLDHIQDLDRPSSMRHNDNDADRHVHSMKRLKDLAYITNTPVLIASHVTESLCEKTEDGTYRPTLYSSKGSREMALKAQLVLGLTLNKSRSACEIEVLKRNNGSVGDKQTVGFLAKSYKFF